MKEVLENISFNFLTGQGEMAARIRNFDWEQTSIGPPGTWSQSLQAVLGMMLSNRFPMLLWWGDQYIQLYNDAYIPVLGAKHPWGLGKKLSECWNEIWDVLQPLVDKPYHGGAATWMDDIELLVNRKGVDEETHFTIAYSPVPDHSVSGGIGGVLATVTEITGQILSNRALDTLSKINLQGIHIQSEDDVYKEVCKALSDNNKDFPFAVIYKIHDDRTMIRACASFGFEESGSFVSDYVSYSPYQSHPDTAHISRALTENVIIVSENNNQWPGLPKGAWSKETKRIAYAPIKIPNKKFSHAILVVGLNPYREFDDQYKKFVHLVAERVAQGVTNVLDYEAERKRVEEIEALDKAKTLFFSNISHEFRTPLTLILGSIEQVLMDRNTIPENVNRIGIAQRNSLRLLRLVNSLLDFSSIESGKLKGNFMLTNISEYTKNIASNFQSLVEKAGLEFEINADAVIQPIYVDRSMWEKIVFNLLSNAFKYTLNGKITLDISSETDGFVLRITDTGIGIPQQELSKIFERFHRVENTKGRTFEGTGIGLSLVKELVSLHNGNIAVKSAEGKGTSFTVKIPFGKDHLPFTQVSKTEQYLDKFSSDVFTGETISLLESTVPANRFLQKNFLQNELVLIVDDNADMRNYLQSLISEFFRTTTAANGMEALHEINKEMPSLILSDIMMPVMDGIQLAKEVKQNPRTQHIPVVLLTARAGEESRIEGYDINADDYLVKPFSSKELLARIRSQLNLSKKRIEFTLELEERVVKRTKELQQQKDFIENIINSSNEWMCVYNLDKQVILINDSALKAMVMKRTGVIGKAYTELYPEAAGTKADRDLELALQGEYIKNDIYFSPRVNRWTQNYLTPLKDKTGTVYGALAIVHDLTDMVKTQIELKKSREHFLLLFNISPVAKTISYAEDGTVVDVNPAWEKLFGRKREDILGKNAEQIGFSSREAREENVRRVAGNGGQLHGFEQEFKLGNDKIIYTYTSAVTLELDGKKCYLAAYFDITQRKKAEEELIESSHLLALKNTELEKLNKDLESFTYITSHDLQEPLRKISTFINLIEKNNFEKGSIEKYFEKINASAQRMRALISSVLEYNGITRANEQFIPIDLNKTLEDVLSDFEFLIKDKEAAIQSDYLPVINSTASLMHQLFSNIIGNSIKFSERKPEINIAVKKISGDVSLHSNLSPVKTYFQLTFTDNGIGFDTKYAEQIFKPFQRLHNRERYAGTGIGLSIVQKIVERHDGFIAVESKDGEGSKFTIWLEE